MLRFTIQLDFTLVISCTYISIERVLPQTRLYCGNEKTLFPGIYLSSVLINTEVLGKRELSLLESILPRLSTLTSLSCSLLRTKEPFLHIPQSIRQKEVQMLMRRYFNTNWQSILIDTLQLLTVADTYSHSYLLRRSFELIFLLLIWGTCHSETT